MSTLKKFLFLFTGLVVFLFAYVFLELKQSEKISPEMSINSSSLLGKMYGKVTAASCGFAEAGHNPTDFTVCTNVICNGQTISAPGKSLCGGACQPDDANICNNTCTNGATNYPSCNQCPTNSSLVGGICTCSNGALPQSNCSQCPAGKIIYNNTCVSSCTITNVCGQNTEGVMVGGTCTAPNNTNPNSTCIQNFSFSASSVNPNGSVEFSWKIPTVPGVGSRCGFVDLTTPTPRPIPGLQNLSPETDRARISNIQTTTRFCLVCQFYKLLDNAVLGDAAVHQWVRVLRIGEN